MRSRVRRLFALGVLLVAASAGAEEPDVSRLLTNLRHEDFRVRTQAALALGASKSARATAPLCSALDDQNGSVRAAAAAALGRLALGGDECLEKRLASETAANVKVAIERALELLDGGEPEFTKEVRYYLAIGKVSDKTGRSGSKLERLVRKSMRGAGSELKAFAFAPSHETPGRAKERVSKHPRVKGYYLSPRLPPFDYTGGNLTVRLEIAMFSYPDKAMVGNYSVKLTQPDVPAPDVQSENELVSMAAERAMEKFAHIVTSL